MYIKLNCHNKDFASEIANDKIPNIKQRSIAG